MVRLFVSDQIFDDGRFSSGAIAVTNDGKIDEFLKDQTEIDKWLNANSNVEVIKWKFEINGKKINVWIWIEWIKSIYTSFFGA